MPRSQEIPDEEAGEEADQQGDGEADDSVAQTEAALAGAQEAQQQAVQAQWEALAEERSSLLQLRQDVQQASGQPSQRLRCTAYFRRHIASPQCIFASPRFACNGRVAMRAYSLVLGYKKSKRGCAVSSEALKRVLSACACLPAG